MSNVAQETPGFKPKGAENNVFSAAEPTPQKRLGAGETWITLTFWDGRTLRYWGDPEEQIDWDEFERSPEQDEPDEIPGPPLDDDWPDKDEIGPEPPAKCQIAGGQMGRKPLRTKNSVTSRNNVSLGSSTLTLSNLGEPPSGAKLIIAFDAEWVEEREPPDPDAEDLEPPEPAPRNRILSYQYACRFVLGPDEEPAPDCEWSGMVYTRHATAILHPDMSEAALALIPDRIEFGELLGRAISKGIELGKLREWPKEVIAAGHWTRADLSAMADYAEIKDQFDAVHKTYVSFKAFTASFTQKDRHVRKFKVRLFDTMLLSPGGHSSLEALGQLYGLQKFETGFKEIDGARVEYKSNMDLYLADKPEEFETYALRDAEICALHVQKMMKFARDDLGLDFRNPPITLGGMAVKFLLRHWNDQGIDLGKVNGFVVREEKVYNQDRREYATRKWEEPNPNVEIHRTLSELSFYGGRNETFWYGPTQIGDFKEFDIAGAYTTALSSLQILDYSKARFSDNPCDYNADQVGFARIKFRFTAGTRYPSLPVKADDQRGLVYPLSGTTYATSPEIAVALHLGAEIEILHGVIIPRIPQTEVRPFESVISELNNRRRQYPDKSFENEMYKQLGNSLYGKTCQGIKGKKAYNTRTDEHDEIGKSRITNIFIAAHVTGLIRALLSELIAGVPDRYTIVSATTDSIITDCPIEEIPLTGPVAKCLGRVRKRLAGLDASGRTGTRLLDVKSLTSRLLSWRTRGIATLVPISGEQIKLAKGGMKVPAYGLTAQNDWLVCAVLTSPPRAKFTTKDPLPFTTAHRKAADHRFVEVEKTANFEYDHKRRIVSPDQVQIPVPGETDVTVEHLSTGTIPWQTVTDFNANRALFEQWRFSGEGRRLKTIADWEDWQQFLAGTAASVAGIRRSKGGVVQQALRIVRKAYVWQLWGLRRRGPGSSYREVAERLSAAGYPTKEQDFKNASRDDHPVVPENVIPAEAPGVRDLVLALVELWPSLEWERLVLDPPTGWLDNSTQKICDRPQNGEMREVEQPVTHWEQTIVSDPGMKCPWGVLKLTLSAHEPTPLVPVRPANSGFRSKRIA